MHTSSTAKHAALIVPAFIRALSFTSFSSLSAFDSTTSAGLEAVSAIASAGSVPAGGVAIHLVLAIQSYSELLIAAGRHRACEGQCLFSAMAATRAGSNEEQSCDAVTAVFPALELDSWTGRWQADGHGPTPLCQKKRKG